ncbi:hypothetical protein [Asticcacaulis sp. EMRT-3]|uniref:hypothetical protein n=1 Tax=Asticcacaulis sp. EMRT-3 TaxID=3040349 RepID=UPI0024AFC9A4|nr:hypothetical protein [Asticcacaulis sp. EMRT-3]MDI7775119.1 hypothetical protein [Asticcacaulis sp. EMRT-3]
MTDTSLIDPAEMARNASSEQPAETMDFTGEMAFEDHDVYAAPVLDRIRTSD